MHKVNEAKKRPEIKIVNYDWLSKSFNSKTKVRETSYLLISGDDTDQDMGNADTVVASSTQPSGSNKRSRNSKGVNGSGDGSGAVSGDDADAAPVSKKTKQSADDISVKQSADGISAKQSADGISALKTSKPKDGQKAKSASLNVPIDEHCTLGGRPRVHIDSDGMEGPHSHNPADKHARHNLRRYSQSD